MGRYIFPTPGSIKSIQRGTSAVSASPIAISAVDMAKARLNVTGWVRGASNPVEVRAILSTSTSIAAISTDSAAQFSWEVVEVY